MECEYALPYDDFYEVQNKRYNIIKHHGNREKRRNPVTGKYRLKAKLYAGGDL